METAKEILFKHWKVWAEKTFARADEFTMADFDETSNAIFIAAMEEYEAAREYWKASSKLVYEYKLHPDIKLDAETKADIWSKNNFATFSKTELEIKQGLRLAFMDGFRMAARIYKPNSVHQ